MSNPLVTLARRTTITTHSIEESLKLYRDTLGMNIWFDGVIDEQQQCDAYDLPAGTKLRVCVLSGSAHDDKDNAALVTGMIGLMEFLDIEQSPPPPPSRRPKPGETLIIFDTEHMREIEKRMNANGYTLVTPPARLNVPGRKVVYELLAYDPNGVRLSFAQNSEID